MGLFVRHHLQPMFDPAQEFIGQRSVDHAPSKVIQFAGCQRVQCFQRRPAPAIVDAGRRRSTAGFCAKKLDFADAAPPDLDIVPLDRDLALAAKRLHLPLHVMHVGKVPRNPDACATRRERFPSLALRRP